MSDEEYEFNERVVWKFPLRTGEVIDQYTLDMPEGAITIHGGFQGDDLCVWAVVDPEAKLARRSFLVRGTGHPFPSGARHVASWFAGPFVWHLFELGDLRRPDYPSATHKLASEVLDG